MPKSAFGVDLAESYRIPKAYSAKGIHSVDWVSLRSIQPTHHIGVKTLLLRALRDK